VIRALALALACVAACRGHEAAPASPTATAKQKPIGQHGDVCALGNRPREDNAKVAVVECGPGLACCYPCGIDGCDSVCHTADECNADQMRP
jgi:hypothetical protein